MEEKKIVRTKNGQETEYIGNVLLDYACYPGEDLYSDGAIEEELLEAVKKIKPENFPALIAEKKDWTFLYHLSPIRTNIVEWLPITKEEEVLEIGSGCGAISGCLAKKAKQLTCVELSRQRSHINAWRNKTQDNMEILVGNFEDIEQQLTKQYEWITLIGVFEYAKGYIQDENPYEAFLKKILAHVKPGGTVVIAIENKFGLKYFAGYQEDHVGGLFEGIEGYQGTTRGVRTFSRRELFQIAKACGVEDVNCYYPYPDYKLPLSIYSDECLPKPGEINCNSFNFDRERVILFDELKVFEQMIQEEMFPFFSNSFLLLLKKEG